MTDQEHTPRQATDMHTISQSIAAFEASRNLADIVRALWAENERLHKRIPDTSYNGKEECPAPLDILSVAIEPYCDYPSKARFVAKECIDLLLAYGFVLVNRRAELKAAGIDVP